MQAEDKEFVEVGFCIMFLFLVVGGLALALVACYFEQRRRDREAAKNSPRK